MRLAPAAVSDAVRQERLRVADLVEDLDEAQWSTPSLCAAWTVRHVVAHLTTTTRTSVPMVLKGAIRARGSFDRMEERFAADRAARHDGPELVAQLRQSADSSRRTPGSSPMDPLMDLVVHGQDIARPLGRDHVSPPDVVVASLAYVAGNRFLGGPRRTAGLRLVATDADWSVGDGPEVLGPASDLLLLASGRPAGLAAATGPGTELIAARLHVRAS